MVVDPKSLRSFYFLSWQTNPYCHCKLIKAIHHSILLQCTVPRNNIKVVASCRLSYYGGTPLSICVFVQHTRETSPRPHRPCHCERNPIVIASSALSERSNHLFMTAVKGVQRDFPLAGEWECPPAILIPPLLKERGSGGEVKSKGLRLIGALVKLVSRG